MRQLLRITTSFALALVLTAGVAFGQSANNNNNATVEQNGSGYSADIDQSFIAQPGPDYANSVDVEQGVEFQGPVSQPPSNEDGYVKVHQVGSRHSATVDQYLGNTNINQVGYLNEAEVDQSTSLNNGNLADIDQDGRRNDATVKQQRFGNESPPQSDHYARAFQKGNQNSITQSQANQGQWAKAVQRGDGNVAEQSQNGRGHVADIFQQGNNNWAKQTQGFANAGYANSNESYITQTGDRNWAKTSQGGGGSNYVEVNQSQ